MSARRTSRQREGVLSLRKMFGMSVGWFGGWAKSYVQVEYANILYIYITCKNVGLYIFMYENFFPYDNH